MKEKLFERDWRFILDAIYRINSIDNIELLEKETLECLWALFPYTQGTFFIAESDTNGKLVYRRPAVIGIEAHYLDQFMNGDYDQDSYFCGMSLISQTETFRDSDLMPEPFRINTKLYRDIYKKQGIHYALRSYLVHNGTLVGNISLFNSKNAGDFDEKSAHIVDIMAPHIAMKLGELLEKETTSEKPAKHPSYDTMKKLTLTAREQEIAAAVLQGFSDREIADKLCISSSTFKKHIYNIYKKMNVNNRPQMINFFNSQANN